MPSCEAMRVTESSDSAAGSASVAGVDAGTSSVRMAQGIRWPSRSTEPAATGVDPGSSKASFGVIVEATLAHAAPQYVDHGMPLSTKKARTAARTIPPATCRSRQRRRPPLDQRTRMSGLPFCDDRGHHRNTPVIASTRPQIAATSITMSPTRMSTELGLSGSTRCCSEGSETVRSSAASQPCSRLDEPDDVGAGLHRAEHLSGVRVDEDVLVEVGAVGELDHRRPVRCARRHDHVDAQVGERRSGSACAAARG